MESLWDALCMKVDRWLDKPIDFWWRLKYRYCKKFGHKWHVEGFNCPDSGYEDFECTRCGETGEVIYY